jgi:DNA polymerase III epsilon subunit-like protein
MSGSQIVFFDTETGGLKPEHPTIQLAAIAVRPFACAACEGSGMAPTGDSGDSCQACSGLGTGDAWVELETFERKIAFDQRQADPEALAMNHYTSEAWKDAQPEAFVVRDFAAFLDRHRSVQLISKRTGKPYRVARLGGHNVVGFDLERIAAMFKRHGTFFAIDFRTVLDTRYGAVWLFEGGAAADAPKGQPENFKLTGLAEHFGIPTDGAHDALFDVRLSIALARRIVELWQQPRVA